VTYPEETPADLEHPPEPEQIKVDGVDAAVWRLGPNGILISSVREEHAGWLAEAEPNTIFFYADLDSSATLVVTEDTMQKVYVALSAQGLQEGQIINAVTAMQNAGIHFVETVA